MKKSLVVLLLVSTLSACSVSQVQSIGDVVNTAEELACSSNWLSNLDSWFWNFWRAAVPFGGQATDTCEIVE